MTRINNNVQDYILDGVSIKLHSSYSNEEYTYMFESCGAHNKFNVFNNGSYIGQYLASDNYFIVNCNEIYAGRLSKRTRAAYIFFKNLYNLNRLNYLTVYISRPCKGCGRTLTKLEHIKRGYGNDCYKKMSESLIKQMEIPYDRLNTK